MYVDLHVTYPSFLSYINKAWIFSSYLRKIFKYQIYRKSVLWKPRYSMGTDGRKDMTKLTVAFRDFTNAPKEITLWKIRHSVERKTETVQHVSIHNAGGQSDLHNLKGKINQLSDSARCKIRPSNKRIFRSFYNFETFWHCANGSGPQHPWDSWYRQSHYRSLLDDPNDQKLHSG
jgi:hypothetical protein